MPTPEGGAEIGLPRLVLAPAEGQPLPTYLIYPVGEVQEGAVTRRFDVAPPPGCVRVRHSSGNPNVFVRADDPHLSPADVVTP